MGSAVGGAFAVSAAAVSAIAAATSSSEGVGVEEEHPLNIIEMLIIKKNFRIIYILIFCCSIHKCIISYRNVELTILPVPAYFFLRGIICLAVYYN